MEKFLIYVVSLRYDTEYNGADDDLVAGYAVSVLRKEKYAVRFTEINPQNQVDQISEIISQKPNVVFFAVPRTSNIPEIAEFSKKIKGANPSCKIILIGWGHHSTTINYDLVLTNCPEIDLIIKGECEITIVELIHIIQETKTLKDCKGIIYRDQEKIVSNEERELQSNLDDLPFPARDTYEMYNSNAMWISTARGCMGRCAFCAESTRHTQQGPKWRGRSPENVIAEIKYLYNTYHVTHFKFLDPTFEDPGKAGKERIQKIAQLIIKEDLDITYMVFMRAENWSEKDCELLKLLYMSGLESVCVGLEAGNENSLKLFKKRATVQDNMNFIELINSLNIYLDYGFIMLHPYISMHEVLENADFLHRSGCAYTLCPYLSRLFACPQTDLYNKLIHDKLLATSESGAYTLYDYKYQDPKIAKLAQKMLEVNKYIEHSAYGYVTNIIKLINYVSMTRRKLLKIPEKSPALAGNLKFIEDAVSLMRKKLNDDNHQWFLRCIEWVESNETDDTFAINLENHCARMEKIINEATDVQIKYGFKLYKDMYK